MLRISKLPLSEDAKDQLQAREYVLTVPFAILGMILFIVARAIDLDGFILLWCCGALLGVFALILVSERSRTRVVGVLTGLTISFLVIEFAGYRDIASFLIAGGSGATLLYANYLSRRDFVQDFQQQRVADGNLTYR